MNDADWRVGDILSTADWVLKVVEIYVDDAGDPTDCYLVDVGLWRMNDVQWIRLAILLGEELEMFLVGKYPQALLTQFVEEGLHQMRLFDDDDEGTPDSHYNG